MIIRAVTSKIKKILTKRQGREEKTRQYTRSVIKKYGKTLRRLSYE